MAFGPVAALPIVDALLGDPALRSYHLLPVVRGDLLARLGRNAEARAELEKAAALLERAAAYAGGATDSAPGSRAPGPASPGT